MAFVNPNKPAGLSPVKYLRGANYDGKGNVYAILAANTNPFYIGDVVALVGGGAATAGSTFGYAAITLATAGNAALGAVIGIGINPQGPYTNTNNLGNTNFRPTGAQAIDYYALVSDDPDIIYEVQEGGSGTNYTVSALGRNSNLIYAAPATNVLVSGTQMDDTAAANTTATLNFRILQLAPRIDNHFLTSPATGGAAQKWWVLIQNHQLMSRPAAP